jgi:hypothetical protein
LTPPEIFFLKVDEVLQVGREEGESGSIDIMEVRVAVRAEGNAVVEVVRVNKRNQAVSPEPLELKKVRFEHRR